MSRQEDKPEIPPKVRRKGEYDRFKKEYDEVLELFRKLNNPATATEAVRKEAEGRAISLIHDSASGAMPFRLRVLVPEDVQAEISMGDYNPIEKNVREFDALGVQHIDNEGIAFYDDRTRKWLRVYGHNALIEPIFPETAPPPSAP